MLVQNDRIPSIQKLFVFLAVVATFFTRPFALGAEYSYYGYFFLLLISLILSSFIKQDNIYHNKNIKIVLIAYVCAFVFNPDINFLLVLLMLITIAYLLFSNRNSVYLYFKYIKNVFLVLIVCSIINFILENSVNPDSLILIDNIRYGEYTFKLTFPFSWTRMIWYLPEEVPYIGGFHYRQYYFFIEPGMVPPIFVSFIYILLNDPNEKYKSIQVALFIIGNLLTFSTSAPLMFFASIAVYYFVKSNKRFSVKNIIISILLAAVAYYVLFYMPFIGVNAKSEISADSADSIEMHSTFPYFVQISAVITAVACYVMSKFKIKNVTYIIIASLMCLGILANYIAYTALFTFFLLWDDNLNNNKNI